MLQFSQNSRETKEGIPFCRRHFRPCERTKGCYLSILGTLSLSLSLSLCCWGWTPVAYTRRGWKGPKASPMLSLCNEDLPSRKGYSAQFLKGWMSHRERNCRDRPKITFPHFILLCFENSLLPFSVHQPLENLFFFDPSDNCMTQAVRQENQFKKRFFRHYWIIWI